jgi:hypothetical protein
MDQHFITNLLRAVSTSPTEKFLSFVDQLKSQWIMEDTSKPLNIILKLDKTHRNMVANGFCINTNKKDIKIVALTFALHLHVFRFDFLTRVLHKKDKLQASHFFTTFHPISKLQPLSNIRGIKQKRLPHSPAFLLS